MPTAMKTIAGVGSSKEGLLMEAGAGFHGPGVVWRSTEEAVKRRRDARRDAELGEKATEQHPDSPSCPPASLIYYQGPAVTLESSGKYCSLENTSLHRVLYLTSA